jgi:hypothetical protein
MDMIEAYNRDPSIIERATVLNQIIGEKGAKNLDNVIDNKNIAEQMEREGKSPQEIRLATGWERGGETSVFDDYKDMDLLKELRKRDVMKFVKC